MIDFNNPYQTRTSYMTNQYAYVNGIEGAKAYLMNPNQTILLMDSDNPIFYLKSSNQLGQSSIRTFKFEEIKEGPTNYQGYLLKSDLEPFIKRLEALEQGGAKNESNT